MKTLLLTLVVVTIVCLDLGNSLKCYDKLKKEVTCPEGMKFCHKDVLPATHGNSVLVMGCTYSCGLGPRNMCCSTDLCNK
uniref:Mipartoxin-3 n=1 Tax=Micrurus mipartitus TaxID=430902 RepID=3SX3_MICMP|nr:RecName: Full=Mipartoxin-3; AltName: Full=Mipartoxin-III; AltName: Full=Three-finger toxin-04; Short=3FTx-04; Flags: Precursor [Micrurus mipartitus]AVI57322.1 mipartoxin-III [Micrurus mipartitus]